MTPALLSEIYGCLAEALAGTARATVPAWIAQPGRQWPLYEPARQLSEHTPVSAMTEAVERLADLTEGSLDHQAASWRKLLDGKGQRPLVVYESMYRNGRISGPLMFAVKAEYERAGLSVAGSELPDHIAVELEFLSYLSEQESAGGIAARRWRRARRYFAINHAAKWMLEVGQRLIATNDPAWSVIGQLLTASIASSSMASARHNGMGFPVIREAGRCSLCGFCVQICPERALRINENKETTRLYILQDRCIQCRKCEQICEHKALSFERNANSGTPVILRQSPRAKCPGCGQVTISEAELAAVAARLDEYPPWLNYCLECRGRGY